MRRTAFDNIYATLPWGALVSASATIALANAGQDARQKHQLLLPSNNVPFNVAIALANTGWDVRQKHTDVAVQLYNPGTVFKTA